MASIQTTIKNRLISMRAAGASIEKQMRFIQDAVIANRNHSRLIVAEVKKLNPDLVEGIKLPSPRKNKEQCCNSDKEIEKLLILRGSLEFWCLAVAFRLDELRKHLTIEEVEEVIRQKKGAMLANDVAAVLKVSLERLNKLDTSGTLPHRFKKRIVIKGSTVFARCWLSFEVASYMDNCALTRPW